MIDIVFQDSRLNLLLLVLQVFEHTSVGINTCFHIVSYLCHPETFEYNRRLRRITEKSDKSKRRSWGNLRRLLTKSRNVVSLGGSLRRRIYDRRFCLNRRNYCYPSLSRDLLIYWMNVEQRTLSYLSGLRQDLVLVG